jgi:hypothetical protein
MPERQCNNCKRQDDWGCTAFKWREPDEETLDEREECWVRPASLPLEIEGEVTFACPRQHINENPQFWSTMWRYYGMYKAGFLPQAGAVSDQSNKAVSIFAILDDINARCDKVLLEKPKEKRGEEGLLHRGAR